MSDDVRDLLVEIAPEPSRRVDVDALLGTARRRRRRGRALAALAGVLVVAVVAAGVAALAGGGGSSRLAVRSGGAGLQVPSGWTPVTVDGAGISLAVPPGWHRAPPAGVANEMLVVGTGPRPGSGAITACVASSPATNDVGTWVSLYEYPSGSTSFIDPTGALITLSSIPERSDFHDGPNVGQGSCPEDGNGRQERNKNTFDAFAFTDAGRMFLARVVTIGAADRDQQRLLARDVLNTLHVEPLTASTTTTVAPDTSTTGGPSTPLVSELPGVPPTQLGTNGGGFLNPPKTADEQAIAGAFDGWLDGKTVDLAAPYVDDFASIRDAEAQGFAQHTPQDVAGYAGRVESVVVVDPNHADVVYTLLHDGAPQYANRPGKAVKVDGTWKVTRDTACALLSVGGITCPPRTTPTP